MALLIFLINFRLATTSQANSAGFEVTQSANGDVAEPYAREEAQTTGVHSAAPQLTDARLSVFSTLVSRAFQERRVEQLSIPEVTSPLGHASIEMIQSFQLSSSSHTLLFTTL